MTTSTLEDLEARHRPEYVAELRKLREEATEEEMAVCRAWHNERFSWPGYGGTGWVERELLRARTAVQTLKSLARDS